VFFEKNVQDSRRHVVPGGTAGPSIVFAYTTRRSNELLLAVLRIA
jgi:hypothetical protein